MAAAARSRGERIRMVRAVWLTLQLRAEPIGLCVSELVEDAQGLQPDLLSRGQGAGGLVGVAQVDEDVGLVVAVVQRLEEAERRRKAAPGVRVLAQVVMGVPERVPGVRLPLPVAGPFLQPQRLRAEGQRLAGLPDQ